MTTKKKLLDIADIALCLGKKEDIPSDCKYISPINLFEDNIFTDFPRQEKRQEQDITGKDKVLDRLYPNDILVKRLNPSFVNIFQDAELSSEVRHLM